MLPAVAMLAASLAAPGLTMSGAANAAPGRRDPAIQFLYTAPPEILRAQRALERLGRLVRDAYSPGEYDDATHHAIRTFQQAHFILKTGWLDFDTYAMLPIDTRADRDDDGVPDEEDRCPAAPEAGRKKKPRPRVGHDGCPIETLAEAPAKPGHRP